MSFFKKSLERVGIGGVKIDAQLQNNQYTKGDTVHGEFHIKGAGTDTDINQLVIDLCTVAWYEHEDKMHQKKVVVDSYSFEGSHVKSGERLTIPFAFELPYTVPHSTSRSPVWITTRADIELAIDPRDEDYLVIKEPETSRLFLNAVRNLGFRLREVEVEAGNYLTERFYQKVLPMDQIPKYVQEFEWAVPSEFRGHIDEIEAVLYATEYSLHVLLTKDQRLRGLDKFFKSEDAYYELEFTLDELNQPDVVERELWSILQK
ncbi:sporulation protein [Aureibacillus halotolerans]|uniref:Sporulation-control protein n=1 Tax=Aureibacillus halotolerans TaxID=1508390 RepID=A0A4R6U273_9BACI|nr:sporulation protein [Aureibacillus halotolerans]TDQ39736.1 sporulation-control protein [Aureibacillus halotolerans]